MVGLFAMIAVTKVKMSVGVYMSEDIKKQVVDLINKRILLQREIVQCNVELNNLQKQCGHENKETHNQEYVGSWTNCLDCGKEDL